MNRFTAFHDADKRSAALLRGLTEGPGPGPVPSRRTSWTRAPEMNSSGRFRKEDNRRAQELDAGSCAATMSDAEVEEGPGGLRDGPGDRRPIVGSQRPIQHAQIHGSRTETNRRLFLPGTSADVRRRTGRETSPRSGWLSPPTRRNKRPFGVVTIRAAHFGHRRDRQLRLSDLESPPTRTSTTALHRKTLDPVLGVLRQRTSHNPALVVHAVDDQAADRSWPSRESCRGHRRERRA